MASFWTCLVNVDSADFGGRIQRFTNISGMFCIFEWISSQLCLVLFCLLTTYYEAIPSQSIKQYIDTVTQANMKDSIINKEMNSLLLETDSGHPFFQHQ